ncbi:MAG: glutathione S-transferase [Ramlibacter sp.]|jgi:glutathione S-transferase|nr:glutathione S-transferase [Ramlibacter sp.]
MRGETPDARVRRALMHRPLLYTYRRCPYAMRARMALVQAGVEFDVHEIVLRDKPADMLGMSPKGTVPVLVLPDGRVVDESLDIMQWAFHGRDPDGWWQRAQSDSCHAFIEFNDGPFKQHLDGYKYPERYPADTVPAFHRDQAVTCLLRPLEVQLGGQPFLGGDQPCAADLAVFPFVRQFRAVDAGWFDVQGRPATQRWLRGWLESELFQRCMRKLAAGTTVQF